MKKSIPQLITLFVLTLTLGCLNGCKMTHPITEKQSSVEQTSIEQSSIEQSSVEHTTDKQQLDQLIKYTDQQYPGDNKNYYWEAGKAELIETPDLSNGQVSFTHDEYGRSSIACGKLTYPMWKASKGSRQGKPLAPPYWPTNFKAEIHYGKTGRTYHGYFYNRSHSISDSLAGKDSYRSADNFTTGTRPQNIGADQKGGMRKAEMTVEQYWKDHPESKTIIDYQVKPVYANADETIPRGTIVNIKSSDNVIDVKYVIINDAEGYKMNYQTGSVEHE